MADAREGVSTFRKESMDEEDGILLEEVNEEEDVQPIGSSSIGKNSSNSLSSNSSGSRKVPSISQKVKILLLGDSGVGKVISLFFFELV